MSNIGKKIGMPATLKLHEFGSFIWSAFGEPPYHVGSSLTSMDAIWRDVDVRLILDHDRYCSVLNLDEKDREKLKRTLGAREFKFWNEHVIESWCAFALGFSEIGQRMTGLPIDFQIQHTDIANGLYSEGPEHQRSCLGIVGWRIRRNP